MEAGADSPKAPTAALVVTICALPAQSSFWAITVGTQMAQYAPILGPETGFFLLGGIQVGGDTLLRFYVMHVIAFPLITAIFLIVHCWRIRKDGGISGPV